MASLQPGVVASEEDSRGTASISAFIVSATLTKKRSFYGRVGLGPIELRQEPVTSINHRCFVPQLMTFNSSSNDKDQYQNAEDVGRPQPDPLLNKHASASDERRKLFELLSTFVNSDIQVGPIEKAVLKLESFKMIPATPEFAELALAGEWRLIFSSLGKISRTPYKLDRTVQRFEPQLKRMINQVDWEFPAKNEVDTVSARMLINCEYTLVGPSRLNIKLLDHKVKILPRDDGSSAELPDNMQAVIDDMRRSIPIEFFDPSGLCDISYIEPEYRVARFLGRRIAGVRDVFIRIPSA